MISTSIQKFNYLNPKSFKVYAGALYEELSECQIDCIEVENVQKSQNKITRPTNRQEELLNRVGLKKLTEGIKLEK